MSEQFVYRWPFIGRRGPLSQVRRGLSSGSSVMIAGAAGVGKSRLAAEATLGLDAIRAAGTENAAVIPFGAFAHVLPGPPPGGENLLRWAARHLGGNKPLVSVDDAHRLDPASAALLHHLAAHGLARLLVTVRNGEHHPEPVAALWKDELVTRIELEPLTLDEVGEVLAGALQSEVEPATVRHLAAISEGNVLYLREIVLAGRATGCLAESGGRWRWRGTLEMTPRLRELVGDRIGHLDPPEREVLELVAFGEPVGTELLVSMASPAAVEHVEDRGLITSVADSRRRLMRLAHPLYGEVVRAGCGSLRTRRMLRVLAESLEEAGLRRREDVLRAAIWRLDSGSSADPSLLLHAANLAWGRHDPRLAARLARAAIDAGAGVEAVAFLGQVLTIIGDTGEAQAILRRQRAQELTERERAQHALALAVNLLWSDELAEAWAVLDEAATTLTDPEWKQEVLIYRGVMDFYAGRMDQGDATLATVRAIAPLTVRGAAHAAACEAWLTAHTGRTDRSTAVTTEALATAEDWQDLAYHAMPVLMDARCTAHLFAGDLAAAARTAEEGVALAGQHEGWDTSASGFGAHRAAVSRLRGDPADAMRWCRADTVRLRARSPYLGRCLGELAHSAALLGDLKTARAAVEEAADLTAHWGFTYQPVMQSKAWIAAAEGDLDTAVHEALAAAEAAERRNLLGYLVFALHDVVRLGAARLVAERLAVLAARMDGPLAALCARQAAAVVSGDAGELRAVSAGFESLGLVLFAAEAAAQEGAIHLRTGRALLARGAQTRAWALAKRCPGVRTPALVELAAPDLTPRQREIVQLAAAGLTNRQIADRLTLSVRTAANHLQAVYDKLGVNDRSEVGHLLGDLT
ncbi:LuxR C-terminal-related transcriptional regulator [Nonomuraea sp. NPDC050556]|uniref:helix-turn-helix transcriptional regulator n=1 Tax=Nonomuraea sp. NPDC050556 TaxID=3364369 RepID=UPI0037A69217